jgi:AcrR family transcriptional regulator
MAISDRRERDKEDMRELILSAAEDIVAIEGFEGVSIRKIAAQIDYSPSIVYHYFKDKDDIMNNLMQRGYRKIVVAVSSSGNETSSPEQWLKDMVVSYIDAALKMPEEFMAAHFYKSPVTLKHTSSLYRGASKEKTAMSYLFKCIEKINRSKDMDESEIELKAQMIIVSAIGLILKIITENIDEEQRKRLIKYFSDDTVLKIAK